MKIERGNGREYNDEDVQQVLRDLYRAPADESYWGALERRIMAVVATEKPSEWWSHFPGWSRLGLTAAAAAVVLVAIATWHTQAVEQRYAYERLIESTSEMPLLTESLSSEVSVRREATLRYLITHD